MAYGLEVRMANNTLTKLPTRRPARYFSTHTVSVGAKRSVFVSIPAITVASGWGLTSSSMRQVRTIIQNGGVTLYNWYPYSSFSVTFSVFKIQ